MSDETVSSEVVAMMLEPLIRLKIERDDARDDRDALAATLDNLATIWRKSPEVNHLRCSIKDKWPVLYEALSVLEQRSAAR